MMIAHRTNVLPVLKKYDHIFIFTWQSQYVILTFCTSFSIINFLAQDIERKLEHWYLKLQSVIACNLMAGFSFYSKVLPKRASRETEKLS